jgi:hypothetical protein
MRLVYSDNHAQFQNILVVGLPSRTDRRDGMVLQTGLSNIAIEFINGVIGSDIPDKAVPTSKDYEPLRDAALGSWRAHMDAIQELVKELINIPSRRSADMPVGLFEETSARYSSWRMMWIGM